MQLKVFEDMSRWQAEGLDILPISINAAPVEFLRDDYAEKFLARLSRFNIPAHKVELEITEQSLSEGGANYVIRALNLLKNMEFIFLWMTSVPVILPDPFAGISGRLHQD